LTCNPLVFLLYLRRFGGWPACPLLCCVVLLCVQRFEVKMVELGKVANFVGQVAELAALAELVCAGLFAPPTLSPRLRLLHAPQHTCVTARSSTATPCVHKPTNPHGALRSLTPLLSALHVGSCFVSHQALAYVFSRINTCVCVHARMCALYVRCVCAVCADVYECVYMCVHVCVRLFPGCGGD
jgi:hypothetical protein